MSRAVELTDEIKEYLEQHYPDEHFSNLYEAAKALLEISKDTEDDEDEDDEVWEKDYESSDGNEGEEPAQPMTELDKAIQMEERHLQLERVLQIEKGKLKKLREDIEVFDEADHEEHGQTITPQEIQRQFAEMALQFKEKKEIELFKQLA